MSSGVVITLGFVAGLASEDEIVEDGLALGPRDEVVDVARTVGYGSGAVHAPALISLVDEAAQLGRGVAGEAVVSDEIA